MEDDENSTVHLACTSLHPEGLSPLTMDLDEDLRALVAKLELGRADPARNSKILIDRLVAHAGHRALIFASPELRDDKTYILQHVKVNGRRLKFASKALKDDREIVKAAINTYGGALEWASPRSGSGLVCGYEPRMRYASRPEENARTTRLHSRGEKGGHAERLVPKERGRFSRACTQPALHTEVDA